MDRVEWAVGSTAGSFVESSMAADARVAEAMFALVKCVADCVEGAAVAAAVAAQGDPFAPSFLVSRASEDGLSAPCRP